MKKTKDFVSSKAKTRKKLLYDCIKNMLNCKCENIILQAQDLLVQGEKYRTNIPNQAEGCWEYKMPKNYQKKMKKTLNQLKIGLR